MNNVIELKLTNQVIPPKVWACGYCDFQLHYIRQDGSIECGGCQEVFEDVQVVEKNG